LHPRQRVDREGPVGIPKGTSIPASDELRHGRGASVADLHGLKIEAVAHQRAQLS
jgi:hypothetical protein